MLGGQPSVHHLWGRRDPCTKISVYLLLYILVELTVVHSCCTFLLYILVQLTVVHSCCTYCCIFLFFYIGVIVYSTITLWRNNCLTPIHQFWVRSKQFFFLFRKRSPQGGFEPGNLNLLLYILVVHSCSTFCCTFLLNLPLYIVVVVLVEEVLEFVVALDCMILYNDPIVHYLVRGDPWHQPPLNTKAIPEK